MLPEDYVQYTSQVGHGKYTNQIVSKYWLKEVISDTKGNKYYNPMDELEHKLFGAFDE